MVLVYIQAFQPPVVNNAAVFPILTKDSFFLQFNCLFLDPTIKAIIEERMPLFREAPSCRLDRSLATSWSRFEEQFDAYLRGEEFPLPAPMKDEPCL